MHAAVGFIFPGALMLACGHHPQGTGRRNGPITCFLALLVMALGIAVMANGVVTPLLQKE